MTRPVTPYRTPSPPSPVAWWRPVLGWLARRVGHQGQRWWRRAMGLAVDSIAAGTVTLCVPPVGAGKRDS